MATLIRFYCPGDKVLVIPFNNFIAQTEDMVIFKSFYANGWNRDYVKFPSVPFFEIIQSEDNQAVSDPPVTP